MKIWDHVSLISVVLKAMSIEEKLPCCSCQVQEPAAPHKLHSTFGDCGHLGHLRGIPRSLRRLHTPPQTLTCSRSHAPPSFLSRSHRSNHHHAQRLVPLQLSAEPTELAGVLCWLASEAIRAPQLGPDRGAARGTGGVRVLGCGSG